MKALHSMILPTVLFAALSNSVSMNESQQIKATNDQRTTLIVTSTTDPDHPDDLQQYVKAVMPMLTGIGGQVIKRSKVSDVYLGNTEFEYLLVMDFPSKNSLIRLFESEEYQRIIPFRDRGFKEINIMFADKIP